MEERKHIDRVYQEKFKDFEASPREEVWRNISTKLHEKKRKKSVLPLWYRMAGVAAVLALFISYTNGLFKTNNSQGSQTASALMDETFLEVSLASQAYTENMIRSSIILQALRQNTQNREAIEAQAAYFRSEKNNDEVTFGSIGNISNTTLPINSENGAYTFSDFEDLKAEGMAEVAETSTTKKRDLPIANLDSKDALSQISEKSSISGKLKVSTMAAPIFYNNMGSGNAIDQRFANNENSSEITLSYGINFAYQISEKIKIRTGISKVDMSYNTNNIAFTATVNPVALKGINYGDKIPNFRIENTIARPFSNISASAEFNRASLASPTTGYLNQQIGFIEVPLEIEYVIVDKKIGINIIGGGSTLFLDRNMISLNSADFSTNLGASNNLNNLSFTTNIGVGLDYNISPKFELNLEPIFKYQMNAFNENTSNVNPYFFGVYSGFSFKF
ncbi:hypothetical protein ACKGJN_03140 [Gillisia sp. Q332]|uniref:hypothetical protein n=1 Tax=Gillisia xinjiangensis TaxID=3384765 RepID=UPI00391CD015